MAGTTITGKLAEQAVANALTACGYEEVSSDELLSHYNQIVFAREYPYVNHYNDKARMDFVVRTGKSHMTYIEVKHQKVPGTADSKLDSATSTLLHVQADLKILMLLDCTGMRINIVEYNVGRINTARESDGNPIYACKDLSELETHIKAVMDIEGIPPRPARYPKLSPIVKWAGGKSGIVSRIGTHLPDKYSRLVEPFVGGGSVFLSIQPARALLSDANPALINMYEVTRDHTEDLVKGLQEMCDLPFTAETYTQTRDEYNTVKTAGITPDNKLRMAVLFIFLNKTCFRGLYRENASGHFNVPAEKGRKRPVSIDYDNIRNIGRYLREADITFMVRDVFAALAEVTEGDVVYLDPPYLSESKTAFTKYVAGDFGEAEHRALYTAVKALPAGAHWILSNNAIAEAMWQEEQHETFHANRSMSAGKKTDKTVPNELLVWGPRA
jgi:DNA adenine methylase